MDAAMEFDLEKVRREIAARSPVSLWDFIPGHNKIYLLRLRGSQTFSEPAYQVHVPCATVGHNTLIFL